MSEVYPHPTWAEIEDLAKVDPIVNRVLCVFRDTLKSEDLLILLVGELATDRARLVRELTSDRMQRPLPPLRGEATSPVVQAQMDRLVALQVAVQDLLEELRIDPVCLAAMADGYAPDYPGRRTPAGWENPRCKVQLSQVVARKIQGALDLGEHVCAKEAPPGTSVLDRDKEAARSKAAELAGMSDLRERFGAHPDETVRQWIERLYGAQKAVRALEEIRRLISGEKPCRIPLVQAIANVFFAFEQGMGPVRVEEACRDSGQPVLRCRICGRTVDRTHERVNFVEGGTCDCDACHRRGE